MTLSHVVAVALAAVGAVLFGLAALRQHGAVLGTLDPVGVTQPQLGQLQAFWRLVRRPDWLVGAAQGLVAGLAHVAALALAPITLVQPVGVLAVPVTVIASAWAVRQRPSRAQVLGSLLSVTGIGVLTVLLLVPATQPVVLPGALLLGGVVLAAVALTGVAVLTRTRAAPLLRCVTLAAAAAVLFGLNSILIRTAGHLVSAGQVASEVPLLVVSIAGVALALPVGLWAMQIAYLSGSAHVVLCCLTLVDPVTAVLGGRLLLHDGVAVSGPLVVAAVGCAALAGWGVVLLAQEYPVDALG